MRKLVLGLIIFVSQVVLGHESHKPNILCDGFLEKNDMRIPVGKRIVGGVDQTEFNAAIDKVVRIYSPIFTQKRQRLQMKKMWDNAQVNAVAYKEGGNSVVEIWGGLARHATMTADAVTLVTCHEVGHHLGGTPKYSDSNGAWAAVEGQADYFATLKCIRKVFRPEMDSWNGEVAPAAKSKCDASHGAGTAESKLCQRIAMASLASANLSAALSNSGRSPSLEGRDTSVVSKTYEKHPQAQCRLDTYMNGNVCRVADTVDVDERDANVGVCRNDVSEEQYGARSLCWYKPAGGGATPPNPQPPAPQPPTPQPPAPQPPPVDGVTASPRLNGQTELQSRNPNAVIVLSWDVSSIPGAAGMYFEVIGPNKDFSDPNGVNPDPQAMRGGSFAQVRGQIRITPARQLPGWGVYRFRVIPLDRSGRRPAGRFSDPATLVLQP